MRILLGVCGGIAAYKSAELVRLLRKCDAEVRVAMTTAATRFVTPLTFQALSGHPVQTELLDAGQEQAMSHIHLARWADTIVVAPATANMLSKLACGAADELLSTLCLAATCPILLAPAMNQAMWSKAATQRNIAQLLADGFNLIGPDAGEQACGEQGLGRMAEPEAICRQLLSPADNHCMTGRRVLISAGPTREPLDPVRYLTNRSSGKMGFALAAAARAAGAAVTLVSGPVALATPPGVCRIDVETALQMYEAVLTAAADCDVYIGAAAVADYRPTEVRAGKIKKQGPDSMIALTRNPDIVAAVAGLARKPFVVGFAAETDGLESYALGKLRDKNLDMIAANQVGQAEGGFDSESNALTLFWPGGRQHLPMAAKSTIASQLIAFIAKQLHENSTQTIG